LNVRHLLMREAKLDSIIGDDNDFVEIISGYAKKK
jgi:hypothetical protein